MDLTQGAYGIPILMNKDKDNECWYPWDIRVMFLALMYKQTSEKV